MSQADKVAYQGYVGPHLSVEVDDRGQIQVAVATNAGANLGTDGWVRADVTNAASVTEALESARRFVAAVFPPGKQSPDAGEWRERRDAYGALMAAGKLGFRSDRLASDVTAFLTEYKQAESLADEGHRPHLPMDKYAEEYERWF